MKRKVYIKYLSYFALSFLTPLIFVASINYHLLSSSMNANADVTEQAVAWQIKTQGTVAPPNMLDDYLTFKSLSIEKRLPKLNTIVFGSSTIMGLKQTFFPLDKHIFNFSQNGHPLYKSLGEAKYFLNYPNIKMEIIALDWYIGLLFNDTNYNFDIRNVSTPKRKVEIYSIKKRIKDSLSLTKFNLLCRSLYQSFSNPAKILALVKSFYGPFESATYTCGMGQAAKDFDFTYGYTCNGFYYDGSVDFTGLPRLTEAKNKLLLSILWDNPEYQNTILTAKKMPKTTSDKIIYLANELHAKQGQLVLILAPVLPKLEQQLEKQKNIGMIIKQVKLDLKNLAEKNKFIVIDASQTERYGCVYSEFIDAHHALPSCYDKILNKFWSDVQNRKFDYGFYEPKAGKLENSV